MNLPSPGTVIQIPSGSSLYVRAVVCSATLEKDSPVARIVYKDNQGNIMSDYAHFLDGQWKIPNEGLSGTLASRFPELQEFVDVLEFRTRSK